MPVTVKFTNTTTSPNQAQIIADATAFNAGVMTAAQVAKLDSFTPSDQAWNLSGNAGTDPTTNFLGTTDAQPTVFKSDSVEGFRIVTSGDTHPGADAARNFGSSSSRWLTSAANQFNVFAANADAQPSARLQTAALLLGAGGASTLDLRVARSAASTLQIDDGAAGAATVVPATDSAGTFGSSALRWALFVAARFQVFAAAGAANPVTDVRQGAILFGAGGGSALDLRIARSAANTLEIDNGAAGAATVLPGADSVGNIGTSTVRWATMGSNQFNVFGTLGDAQPTSRLQTAALLFGAGGPTAVDLRLSRTSAHVLRIDDGAGGAASVVPGGDFVGSIGTPSLRWGNAVSKTFQVFAGAGDVNPATNVTPAAVLFGAGGASSLDVQLARSAASTLQIDDGATGAATIVPATDIQGTFGSSALRWLLFIASRYQVFAASGDANPVVDIRQGAILFGAGGASALDLRLARSAANTLQLDDGATGGANLLPATDNTGSVGSASKRFALVRATVITSGDYAFEDENCANCGRLFAEAEDVVFRIRRIEADDEGKRVSYTVPVHVAC